MPRTELVLELVRAGASGDTARLKSTAERMIAEEKAKRDESVAANDSSIADKAIANAASEALAA